MIRENIYAFKIMIKGSKGLDALRNVVVRVARDTLMRACTRCFTRTHTHARPSARITESVASRGELHDGSRSPERDVISSDDASHVHETDDRDRADAFRAENRTYRDALISPTIFRDDMMRRGKRYSARCHLRRARLIEGSRSRAGFRLGVF